MTSSQSHIWEKQAARLADALRRNRMDAYFVASRGEVAPLVETLLHDGDTIATGGSVTLAETGVLELLQSGKYRYIDRTAPGLSSKERRQAFADTARADVFLCSCNAVTMRGELYNVDGNGNRVSAIAHGPASVIVVAGMNKLVSDLPAAVKRVKTVAAPQNGVRLGLSTPCALTGACVAVNGGMTDGCDHEQRMCCHYLVSGKQRQSGRVKVILVGEPLGY